MQTVIMLIIADKDTPCLDYFYHDKDVFIKNKREKTDLKHIKCV